MSSKHDPKLFAAISDFVNDLYLGFGKQQGSLQLFQRFITRLKAKPCSVSESEICECFSRFVRQNEEAITTKDVELMKLHVIAFKGTVNIKLKEIFRLADPSAKESIWAHLAVILAIVDPDGAAVESLIANLKESSLQVAQTEEKEDDSKEAEFLESILSKFAPNPEEMERNMALGGGAPNIDLMGMVNTVTNMFQSQNGLDPEKLLSSMSRLTTKALGQLEMAKKK